MRAPWQAGAPVRDRVAALLAALDAPGPLLPAGGNRGLLELDPARARRWALHALACACTGAWRLRA
jgi:hypothetical protein